MFTFFRRRSATAADQTEPQLPSGEQSVDSPEARAHLTLFAGDLTVSGPFVEPGSDEYDLWRAGKLVPWYISHHLDRGRIPDRTSISSAMQRNRPLICGSSAGCIRGGIRPVSHGPHRHARTRSRPSHVSVSDHAAISRRWSPRGAASSLRHSSGHPWAQLSQRPHRLRPSSRSGSSSCCRRNSIRQPWVCW